MNKIYTGLLTILFGLTALPAKAQTVPFLEEGKTWTMEHFSGIMGCESTVEKLTIKGDTVIADRVWKKMYLTGNGYRKLAAVLYEENGKVRFLPYFGATEGKLLYDFNMKKGDEGTFFNPHYRQYLSDEDDYSGEITEGVVKITDTEKRTFGEKELNCFSIQSDDFAAWDLYWFEGIGNTFNPLCYMDIFTPGNNMYHLLDCRTDNGILYEDAHRYRYGLFRIDGKTWRVERRRKYDLENNTNAASIFERYLIDGDTVIANKSWMKLYSIREDTGEKTLLTVIREDEFGKNTFLPYAGATDAKILYDFDSRFETGSQCTHYKMNADGGWPASKEEYEDKHVTFTIQDTHLIESNGRYLSIFNTAEAADAQKEYTYLESVGSLTDPFRVTDEDYVSHVVECSVGDKVIYSEKVWKEPSTGIENVCGESGSAGGNAVYDLSGRRLHQKPAHGVYIRNGKKHIVR